MSTYLQQNQPRGVPPLELTGERTLPDIPAENYWFQRHLAVYEWIGARVIGLRVIDMACGEGYGSEVLSRSASSVVGIDANPEAYEHARLRYRRQNLCFERGVVEAFGEPGAYDAVVFLQTIEHVLDPAAVLSHFRAILAPGGVAYVSTPNVLTLALPGQAKSGNPWHVREYRAAEFDRLCRSVFEEVELLGLFHARKLRAHALALSFGWDRAHRALGLTRRFYDWFTPAISAGDFVLRPARAGEAGGSGQSTRLRGGVPGGSREVGSGAVTEGRLEWDGGWTWYRVEGDLDAGGKAPLVLLHGGPGAAHDYLESILELATVVARPCVIYDQLGCGRSQHLPEAEAGFWTVELFRRELNALLEHLGISGRYHVLGQSWGGMLGMEHALERPHGLRSLIVANSPASMDLWVRETNRLRSLLPEDVQDALTRHEEAGTTDSEEYAGAVMVFYERHLCRIPFPDGLQRTFAQLSEDPTVYHTMNGPSEFHVIGTLRNWNITPRLGEVRVPVLVISGEYDEATPAVVGPLVEALPDVRWELIEGASHSTHLERPELFLELVEDFLAAHD